MSLFNFLKFIIISVRSQQSKGELKMKYQRDWSTQKRFESWDELQPGTWLTLALSLMSFAILLTAVWVSV